MTDLADKASLQRQRLGAGRAERRAARERAPPARARTPARGRGLRMTPPPPPPPRGRGRAGDDDLEHVLRRSRRRRDRTRGKRKRRTTLIFVVLLVIVLAVIAVGRRRRRRGSAPSCDLKELQAGPDRRELVRLRRQRLAARRRSRPSGTARRSRSGASAPGCGKATVAIEDHRFYEHGGVDYEGIARAAWKDLRAGHVVQGGSTITQQLVRNLYISKERTLKRKLKEACLAIKLSARWLEGLDPRPVHEPGLLRQPRLRDRGRGADVLLEARARAHPRPGGAARRPAAGAVGLRPAAPARGGASRGATRCCARCATTATSPRRSTCARSRRQNLQLKPGKLYTRIREPYFFSYVRDQLIAEYGANTVRSGGLRVYTTIDPRLQVAARKAITDTLYLRNDPAAAVVSINPANGAIRAMTAVTPGPHGQPVQPRRAGAPPARLDLQDVRADRGDQRGHEPRLDLLHLGAVPLPARPVHARLGRRRPTTTRTRARSRFTARRSPPTTRSTRS